MLGETRWAGCVTVSFIFHGERSLHIYVSRFPSLRARALRQDALFPRLCVLLIFGIGFSFNSNLELLLQVLHAIHFVVPLLHEFLNHRGEPFFILFNRGHHLLHGAFH